MAAIPIVTRSRCCCCRRPVELHELAGGVALIEPDADGVPRVHACPEDARSRWVRAWHLARLESPGKGGETRLSRPGGNDSI